MGHYESYKTDNAPQNLTAGTWATVDAEGHKVLTPPQSSRFGAEWVTYLNIKTPKLGGASEVTLRWVRNPGTPKADETGRMTFSLKKGATTWISHVWLFQAIKGQPVALQIVVNGKATLQTRELKLAWEVDK